MLCHLAFHESRRVLQGADGRADDADAVGVGGTSSCDDAGVSYRDLARADDGLDVSLEVVWDVAGRVVLLGGEVGAEENICLLQVEAVLKEGVPQVAQRSDCLVGRTNDLGIKGASDRMCTSGWGAAASTSMGCDPRQ